MVKVFGHRGSSRNHTENTIEAFEGAVRDGAHGVELDVRLLTDGRLAVHHDPHLHDGRALHRLASTDLPAGVPLLGDALDACGDLTVNVEIKNIPGEEGYDPDAAVVPVLIAALSNRSGPEILVSCFDPGTLSHVRSAAPDLGTGLLIAHEEWLDAFLDLAVDAGHVALHPWDVFVDEALVARCHELGLACNVWTVNDPDRMRTLARWGVDTVITDCPDVALETLRGPADM